MKYKTIRSLVRFIMNIIADVEVVGMDKLPQGNVILAANHLGRLDTAVLIYALEREDLIMAVAEKYKDHPIFGAIGRSVNAIWLIVSKRILLRCVRFWRGCKKAGSWSSHRKAHDQKQSRCRKAKWGRHFSRAKAATLFCPSR